MYTFLCKRICNTHSHTCGNELKPQGIYSNLQMDVCVLQNDSKMLLQCKQHSATWRKSNSIAEHFTHTLTCLRNGTLLYIPSTLHKHLQIYKYGKRYKLLRHCKTVCKCLSTEDYIYTCTGTHILQTAITCIWWCHLFCLLLLLMMSS